MRPLSIGLRAKPISLDARAMSAVKRSGGVVHLPGAATPVLGPNKITNGGFDTAAGWTIPAGQWSVSGGVAAAGGASGSLVSPNAAIPPGVPCLVEFEVVAYTSGTLYATVNANYADQKTFTSVGRKAIVIISGTNTGRPVEFYGGSFSGAIDNVTVCEIIGYTYGTPPARNFFDSSGTDIIDGVTQMDNPVGLALDAAGRVGPELNPDTGFTNPAGWSVSGADATHIVTFADGKVRYQSGLTTPSMTVQAPAGVMPPGTYEVTATCSNWVSGSIKVFESAAGRLVVDKAGTVSTILKTTIDLPLIFYRNSENVDLTLSFLGIKRVYGDLASQGAVGSKPTIRRGPLNECLWSSDFANAVWVKQAATVSGMKVKATTTNDRHQIYSSGFVAQPVGSRFTYAAIFSAAEYSHAVVTDLSSARGCAVVNLADGSLVYEQVSANSVVTKIEISPGKWLVCLSWIEGQGLYGLAPSFSGAPSSGAIHTAYGPTFVGDGNSGINIHATAIYRGTLTAQQILDAGGIPLTTTAPASSAKGKCWWQFDTAAPGDYLGMGIQTGETGWIAAAVTCGAAATANETIFANGAGSANLKGVWLLRNGGSGEHVMRMGVGNGVNLDMVSAFALPTRNVPRVVEGGWDASSVFVGVDGNVVTAARSGSATPAPNTPMIGAYSPGNHHLNGALHAQVICPVVPPAQDRNLILRWLASRQGRRL